MTGPESPPDAMEVLEAIVAHLTKLEAACRAVATELAGLRQDLAWRAQHSARRRPPEPGSVALRRR